MHTERERPENMLRRLRHRSRHHMIKLRQVDLARQIQVDTRTIQQWETGDRLPRAHNLQKLIRVYVEQGVFLPQFEKQEAFALWEAFRHTHDQKNINGRLYPIFDEKWFVMLLHEYKQRPDFPSTETLPVQSHAGQSAESSNTQNQIPSNLPTRLSRFVGRQEELKELLLLLDSFPVVTLIGPGGSGKTRLAYQATANVADHYPDGVWLIDLTPASDSLAIIRVLIDVLGIEEQKNTMMLNALLSAIQDKKQLLLFDNCEHLIDSCAELIQKLLSAAPGLTVLATSREPLNIDSETVYRVPPLGYPEPFDEIEQMPLETMMAYESVQLFMERASSQVSTLTVTKTVAECIVRICSKLDGIPLSLELAAARVQIMSVMQIEERLSNLFSLLSSGKRPGISRHQSLWATIEWSFSLLMEKEQLLLQRLSVFSDGFDLEAVEEICSGGLTGLSDATPLDKEDIPNLLSNLVNKSLVTIHRIQSIPCPRFALLDSIKQFAAKTWAEEFHNDEHTDICKRHTDYYYHFLAQAEAQFRSDLRDSALAAIRREYANILSALQWCCSSQHGEEIAVRMAACLYFFWLHERALQEGLLWLHPTVHLSRKFPPNRHIAKALHGISMLYWVKGEIEESISYCLQNNAMARELNDAALLASNLRLLTQLSLHSGLHSEARISAEESVRYAKLHGDVWNLASSLYTLGNVSFLQGELTVAENLLLES